MEDLFYRIAALLILAAFYGCYLLKMLRQKSRGIVTDQMGKGKSGSELRTELIMKAATYIAPLAELLSIFLVKSFPPVPVRTLGIALGILGDIVFIASVVTMRDSWRAGVSETDKTALVTGGIYSVSRNPAFLGFDLTYAGLLCLYFNWLLLAASVFAATMFHLQIVLVEEKFLPRAFGKEYAEYARHVRRYLGRKR